MNNRVYKWDFSLKFISLYGLRFPLNHPSTTKGPRSSINMDESYRLEFIRVRKKYRLSFAHANFSRARGNPFQILGTSAILIYNKKR